MKVADRFLFTDHANLMLHKVLLHGFVIEQCKKTILQLAEEANDAHEQHLDREETLFGMREQILLVEQRAQIGKTLIGIDVAGFNIFDEHIRLMIDHLNAQLR